MKKNRITILPLLLLLLPLAAFGDNLHIYVAGPFSNNVGGITQEIFKAVELFADEANEKTIKGHRVFVFRQDDGGNIDLAKERAKRPFGDDKHLVTIGQFQSSLALPTGKLYGEKGKLFFTPMATSSKITEIGGSVFQICFNDQFQGHTLATFATEKLKKKNILILTHKDDAYSEGLSQHFKEKLPGGIKIEQVFYDVEKLMDTKLTSKIRAQKPDLIFLPDLKPYVAKLIKKFQRDPQIKDVVILGADGWGINPSPVEIPPPLEDRNHTYYYSDIYHPSIPTSINRQLLDKFKAKGIQATGTTILAYQSLKHLERIINQTGSLKSSELARSLRYSSYTGPTGPVTFTKNGTERNLVIMKITRKGERFDSLVGAKQKPRTSTP